MKTVISMSKSRDNAYDEIQDEGRPVNFANLVHALSKANKGVVVFVSDVRMYVETRTGQPLACYDLELEEAIAPRGKELPLLHNYA